jgi:hypothetical protein
MGAEAEVAPAHPVTAFVAMSLRSLAAQTVIHALGNIGRGDPKGFNPLL